MAGTLEVVVSTIYALSMPKYVYVQLFAREGAQTSLPLKIRADRLEETTAHYILKLGEQTVGKISHGSVIGWWIQDENEGPVIA